MLRETGCCDIALNETLGSAEYNGGVVERVWLNDGSEIEADYWVDSTGDGKLCRACDAVSFIGIDPRPRFNEPGAPEEGDERAVNGVTLLFRSTPIETATAKSGPPEPCWWPEFRQFRYAGAFPALGVRETRRILCEYMLTENDVAGGLSRQRHPDIIGITDHPFDTHGNSTRGRGDLSEPYGIPYRTLIPKGFKNLLVACRSAGFSSIAASSCRLSRTMMQLGQAAGTAAAIAKNLNCVLPDVPAETLTDELRTQRVSL